ncbi:MAG: RNA polymerase sigma factor [Chloroflexota bacterium]
MTENDHLLTRCQQGELAAFTELFTIHEARVYRLALTILYDSMDAEDAVQDVFLRVFRNIGTYRGQASFTTWLTAIVVNTCRDKLRRRKLRQTFSLDWLYRQPTSQTPDIAETIEERWRKETVWAKVAQLDEAYRLPVILFYHEGLNADEVAHVLDLSVQNVYSRLNAARKLLRGALASSEALAGRQVKA